LFILPALPLALGLNLFKVGPSSAIAFEMNKLEASRLWFALAFAIALSKTCLISIAAFLFVNVSMFNAS